MVIIFYVFNQYYKTICPIESLRLFLVCYANDILAGILILAYSNICLSFISKSIIQLPTILWFILGCGFVWEILAPLFKPTAIFDPLDLLAYLIGGIIYWWLQAKCVKKA